MNSLQTKPDKSSSSVERVHLYSQVIYRQTKTIPAISWGWWYFGFRLSLLLLQGYRSQQEQLHSVESQVCPWVADDYRYFYPTRRCPYRYSAKLNTPLPLGQGKRGVENSPPNLDPQVIWLANNHPISAQPLYDVIQRAVAKCPKVNLENKGYQIPSFSDSGSGVTLIWQSYLDEI